MSANIMKGVDLKASLLVGVSRQAAYTLLLCVLSTVCLFADQNLMAPALSVIAREFGISEDDRDARLGGDVAVAFFVVGGPFGIFAGWFTDTYARTRMYGAVTMIGALGSFSTSLVQSHTQLLCARALTGIAVGGAAPVLFSLLSDTFAVEKRNLVVATVGFAMAFGSMCGQALSGTLLMYGWGWKMPFLLVSIPCFVCGMLVATTLQEPARATQEAAVKGHLTETTIEGRAIPPVYQGRVSTQKVREIFLIKTNLLLFLQGIPGCVPWGVIYSFLNSYLSTERGATVMEATAVILMWNIGDFLGKIVGGLLGQWLYNRRKAFVCWLMGATTICSVLPMLYLVNAPFNVHVFSFVAVLGGTVAGVTGANIKALVLNVNLPETRGVANGIFGLTDDVGRGFGPALIALVEAAAGGRQRAFSIAALFWVLCGLLLFAMGSTCEADEAAVQAAVEATAAGVSTDANGAEPQTDSHLQELTSQ